MNPALQTVSYSIRPARQADVAAMQVLIAESARHLSGDDYTHEQTEAAITHVFGVDSELLEDESYFVVEDGSMLLACGGWSRRKTLFGGDQYARRESGYLDPAIDAAKIRAFFVHPQAARRGIGRALLEHCEAQARAHGFARMEMMATLPGVKLYAACGFVELEPFDLDTPEGVCIPYVKMGKAIGDAASKS